MAATYRVSAPYVTLKVIDSNGAEVVQGFYAGGLVSDPVPGDSLDKHVRTGMIEAVSASKAEAPKAEAEKPQSKRS